MTDPTPTPKLMVLTIHEGDFENKFRPWTGKYSRPLNERHLKYLRKDWNDDLSGLLILVAYQDEDKLLIIDGQHRIAACSRMPGEQKLIAQVWQGETLPVDVEEMYFTTNIKVLRRDAPELDEA
jgi:hypothetical protein